MPSPALEPDVLKEIERRLDPLAQLLPELGRQLCEMQSSDLETTSKSNGRDLVTAADFASEKAICEFIRERFPGDAILSEESEQGRWRATVESKDYCWVIDPIDGTNNYSHGLPLFCISVGLTYRGEPTGGLVLAPALNELFRAVRDRGTTLNGDPIQVSSVERLGEAMVVTGFPYSREKHLATLLKGVEIILLNARGLRRTGTAALDLCWCASGRFDAYYEYRLNPWDTCAGLVILREAGGRITNLRGEHYEMYTPTLVASNGRFHDELLEALKPIPHDEWE